MRAAVKKGRGNAREHLASVLPVQDHRMIVQTVNVGVSNAEPYQAAFESVSKKEITGAYKQIPASLWKV